MRRATWACRSISFSPVLRRRRSLRALASSEDPFGEWPNSSLHGVTNFELIKLAGILMVGEYSSEHLHGNGEEQPLVMQIPDGLVRMLAAMDQGERDRVARCWKNDAEGFAEWPIAEVAEVL